MSEYISKSKDRLNYLITYFVIASSGIPFFNDGNRVEALSFMLILGLLFVYYKGKLSVNLAWVVLIALFIMLIQSMVFRAYDFFTFFSFTGLMVFTPYFAVKLLGPHYLKYYLKIMRVLALIALFFWLATNLVPGFHQFTYAIAGWLMPYTDWRLQESLIVYTFETSQIYGMYRNPGPFHEPGAYAVFLILAIIGEILYSGKLFSAYNILFFLSVATTFSTAGYIGMFIVFSFYFITSKRLQKALKVIISIIVMPFIVYLFISLEFLNQKVAMQYKHQTETSLSTPTSGRFLGMRKALVVLQNHHVYGRGLLTNTQPDAGSEEAASYGWLYWVSRLGIIFGPLYLYFIYRTFKNYSITNLQSSRFAIVAFLAFLAALTGQKFTGSTFVFILFFMSMEYSLRFRLKDYKISN